MQKTKQHATYYEDYVAEMRQRAALREASQAQPKPGSDRALAIAAQYEFAALRLRQAAQELEATRLNGVENVSFWEWDQHQPGTRSLELPVEFTAWTLTREAELLEARAREMRGERP